MVLTPAKKYATALIKSLREKSQALRELDQNQVKGVIREAFVDELLRHYLPSQFVTGTGVVVNEEGSRSNQTDIVICDTHKMLPLVRGSRDEVYPWQAVVAVIEVKSVLNSNELKKSQNAADTLIRKVCVPRKNQPPDYGKPFTSVFAIESELKVLESKVEGKQYLGEAAQDIRAICCLGKFSWMFLTDPEHPNGAWRPHISNGDLDTCEETKRFLALLIDNIRRISAHRFMQDGRRHHNWLGDYIRYP